uniref:CDAN1-interacting nuclease 1 n=1 Tax=Lutzomyia longipalpis TaxID=7200 RepID=A0A1B0FV59_LUTLO
TQLKTTYYHIQAQSSTILQQYESEIAENPNDDSILLNKSIDVKFSPVGLARLLLTEKYKGSKTKGDISNMVKSPYLIPDMALAANKVGLVFHDEGDLRRTGYDKTPDLKLVVPCLYRGIPIHWIESKALFGDVSNHEKYVREQLSCYQNRFGAGIVIYWMGYIESLDRDENIFVRDSFPDPSELTLLK